MSMDLHAAWSLFIAGLTETAFGRQNARQRPAEPLVAWRFTREAGDDDIGFDEFFAAGCAPAAAVAALQAAEPLAEHYLTVLAHQPGLALAYARLGYRLDATEQLMARTLQALPPATADYPVTLVRSVEEAAWLNANDPAGLRWVREANLADGAMRHYYISLDGRSVARGRVLYLPAGTAFVSQIHTAIEYRQRGLGRALMLRLLHDAAANGMQHSLLAATPLGTSLYRNLGYSSLGTLLILQPTHMSADEAAAPQTDFLSA